MSKFLHRLTLLSLLLVWIAITYFSLKSASHSSAIRINDKIGHFLAYAVLSLHALAFFQFQKKKHIFWLVLTLVGYGLLMEILQGFVPGREVSAYDLLANCMGVGIGLTCFTLWRRYRRYRTNG
jgi:VanZ family protein